MKDIIQNIKINALTDKANSKLKQMKSTMLSMPKSLTIDNTKYNLALAKMKTSLIGLAGVATTAFLALKKGFQGLALDLQSVNRLNTALETTGNTANISQTNLTAYFESLLKGIGLSAGDLNNLAARLISAGASSLSMVKQYTNAIVGIADKTGKSTDLIATKFIAAMNGKTKGLVDFGVAVDGSLSKQLMLNQALRNGQIAFDNIDPTSATRSLMILKLSWDNMILGLAAPMLPAINKIMQSIAKNALTIGRLLLSTALITGINKIATLMWSSVTAMIAKIAAIRAEIKARKLSIILSLVLYMLLIANTVLYSKRAAFMREAVMISKQRIAQLTANLTITNQIGKSLLSANGIIMIGSIALGAVIANWGKIKLLVTGVSELQNAMFQNAANGFGSYVSDITNIIGQLKYYAKQLSLTADEIKNKNRLIEDYNNNYAGKYGKLTSDNTKSVKDLDDAIKSLNDSLDLQIQKQLTSELVKTNIKEFAELGTKILKSKNKIKLYGVLLIKLYNNQGSNATLGSDAADVEIKSLLKKIAAQNAIIVGFKNDIALTIKLISNVTSEVAPTIPLDIKGTGGSDGIDKAKKSTLDLLQAQLGLAKTTEVLLDDYNTYNQLIALNQRLLNAVKNDPNDPLAADIERLKYQTLINNLLKERNLLYKSSDILSDFKPGDMTSKINLKVTDNGYDGSAIQDTTLSAFERMQLFLMTKQSWTDFGNSMLDGFLNPVNNGFSQLGQSFANVLTLGANFGKQMKNIFKSMANSIIALLGRITAKMIATFAFQRILGLFTGGTSNVVFSALGLADGGYISGRGSSTSDSIPAMLSNGLYVVNAKATKENKQLLDSINGYASGGYVGTINRKDNDIVAILTSILNLTRNKQPVITQVIDLPTLNNATRIGGAMIIQGI